jgi:hypothetical protein
MLILIKAWNTVSAKGIAYSILQSNWAFRKEISEKGRPKEIIR